MSSTNQGVWKKEENQQVKQLKYSAIKPIGSRLLRQIETLINLSKVEKQYIELVASYSIELHQSIEKEIADLVDKHKIYLIVKT